MGKWCEVKCNCSDREPLPGSEWHDYGMYRKHFLGHVKPREEWEERVRRMYKCGHREGALVEFWPGDLFKVGLALEAAYRELPEYFEVFRRISNSGNYYDEYLTLSAAEAALWQLEIEQLQLYLSGEEFMGWHEKVAFEKALSGHPFLYGDIQKTLKDGLTLCEASAKTGNPIEFFR